MGSGSCPADYLGWVVLGARAASCGIALIFDTFGTRTLRICCVLQHLASNIAARPHFATKCAANLNKDMVFQTKKIDSV